MAINTLDSDKTTEGLGEWSQPKTETNTVNAGAGYEHTIGSKPQDYALPTFAGGVTGIEAKLSELLSKQLGGVKAIEITGIKVITTLNNPGLKYSVIAVISKNDVTGGNIFYTISIDNQSAGTITPETMIQLATAKMNSFTQNNDNKSVFFPTDYIDASLGDIVKDMIGDHNSKHVGSILVNNQDLNIEDIVPSLAAETFKCLTGAHKILGSFPNNNLTIGVLKNSPLRCTIMHTTGTHGDLSGRVSTPTWAITLDDARTSNLVYGQLNTLGGSNHVHVKGRLQFIPVEVETGYMVTPDICITTIDTKNYTTEYTLLALVMATNMVQLNRWVENIIQTQYPVGVLNKIVNISGVAKPTAIDIFDKASPQVSAARTLGLIKGAPFVSLAAKSHAENSTQLRLFVDGANGNNVALDAIVKAAHKLTDGKFDINYPRNDIFHATKTRLPDGVLSDGRSADSFGILDVLNNPNFTEVDYSTETAAIVGNGDTVANRSAAIVSTGITATYTGIVDIVRFEPKFIAELYKACENAGLKVAVNDNGVTAQNTGLGFTRNLFANAYANVILPAGNITMMQGGQGGAFATTNQTTMKYFQ